MSDPTYIMVQPDATTNSELTVANAEIARLRETVAQVRAAWFGPCKFDLESDGRVITAILAKATATEQDNKQ